MTTDSGHMDTHTCTVGGAAGMPRKVSSLLTSLVVLALVFAVAPPASSSDITPDDHAVQMLYELNRSRWDPASAPGVPVDAVPMARPPLAWNASLAEAASFHAGEMVEHGYVGHQSAVTGIWPNELARSYGFALADAFPDESNGIESIHVGSYTAAAAVASLTTSSGHRYHLYGVGGYGVYDEAGVGRSSSVWVIQAAYTDNPRLFVTGVVYDDRDGDGLLDPGEGLAGITVDVGQWSTTTSPGGAYSVKVRRGDYTVTVSGAGFEGEATAQVSVRQTNVGAEFRSGEGKGIVRAYERCAGREPTILGTDGDDVLYGTDGADVIHGLDGDDLIFGLDGDDLICGGRGSDDLRGGLGNDFLKGDGGEDRLVGGPGDDRIGGGFGGDALYGGEGLIDRLTGGMGIDSCATGEIVRACEG